MISGHALFGFMAALAAAAFVAALAALFLLACAAAPDPRAAVYGAQRLRCVQAHDAAPAARECMRLVDRAYAQDGGLR
jgi:hypothetical protein